MRKTIKKVMIEVVVLMTSCQESEYRKTGPRAVHTRIRARAAKKLSVVPRSSELLPANRRKNSRGPEAEMVSLILRDWHGTCQASAHPGPRDARPRARRDRAQPPQCLQ